jgi:hypothetical protein
MIELPAALSKSATNSRHRNPAQTNRICSYAPIGAHEFSKRKKPIEMQRPFYFVFIYLFRRKPLYLIVQNKKSHFICNKATRASGPSLGRDEQAPPLCQITWLKSDRKPSLFLLNLSSSFCKIPRNWNTTQSTDEYN